MATSSTGTGVSHEPIAVVGMACRLPKAPDPATFWQLLREGRSAVDDAPPRRRQEDSGLYGPGGYLDRIDGFDAAFFNISPREAVAMDPQQRLLLELSWEALEDAGIRPPTLARSRTGVFVGAFWDDYTHVLRRQTAQGVSRHTMTGVHRSILANRVSYTYHLAGPSLTVDTAQSSSLVAVHLACESLARGESELAFAGGVNLSCSPETTELAAARFGGLSASGRCHTFDARADGFVRGEGGGLVVLKPLAAALRDGDTVYCVIRGSAVNSDGATDGLTLPSGQAQQDVVRLACEEAGVRPDEIQYVELHGTGTPVGDPIEAAALGAALGRDKARATPLAVGSAKTNVGHLEAAAGIVGLLKTALSIHHRQLVPSLNFTTPNPAIPLGELGLAVQEEPGGWPRPDQPLIAGVSSFGMGGTNAHLIVAAAPTRPVAPAPKEPARPMAAPPVPWTVSAHSAPALRAQAGRLRAHLAARPAPDAAQVGHALAATRAPLAHRAVLLGGDTTDLLDSLGALAEGGESASVVSGEADNDGKLAFLFSGQGAQRLGMGRELYAAFPVFAEALDEAFAALDVHLDRPLREIVFGGGDRVGDGDPAADGGAAQQQALLDQTAYTQPALFAIETSLYRLVTSFGLKPDYLLGHSVGEIAAAHVAGCLSLEDASALVTARGRLMQAVHASGAMAAWQASADEAADMLAGHEESATVAALNGPASVVISGDRHTVEELTAAWRERGRKASLLKVSHAFHSPHMDSVLDDLRAVADRLTFRTPVIPVVSNVTGRPVTGDELAGADYWARHVREPVQFLAGVRGLCEKGVTTFVELGPDAPLSAMARECFPVAADTNRPRPAAVAVCRRGRDEPLTLLTALAQAYVRGADVDFTSACDEPAAERRVSLPTYAFQRERHWPDAAPALERATHVEEAEAGRVEEAEHAAGQAEHTVLAGRLAGLSVADQERTLLGLVAKQVAVVLGSPSGTVETARTFKQLGFDSMAAAELSERLGTVTGLPLPATLTFDHPTPLAVAGHLRAQITGTSAQAASVPLRASDTDVDAGTDADTDPVVIVAMSCRYPGGANSPEDLWRLVAQGGDAVGAFPTDRGWDLERLFHPDAAQSGTSSTRQGGFLYDAADFDAEFFDISPREALAIDPQQRLLLECAWEAFERAGLDPRALKGSPTGVFVGMTGQDYGPRLHEPSQSTDGYLLTGNTPSVASGRLSFSFGLEGPALTVDTACSSSLVTLHLAAQALRRGECDLALAGGATVLAGPGMFTEFSRQRGLAPDGRCKPFADGADGTGWAEGVGLVLLERQSEARRKGHKVLAVLRGSAINQDGASNGLTAPNGPSQQRVIRAALTDARLEADGVDVVEAHGTGTTLGDPIEAQALLAVYGQGRPAERPLWLGSVKSNIGHTQAAAGVAGVIKMVMALRRELLPATLHVDEPSGHVDWSAGAVRLLTEPVAWARGERPRRAAVSSFGISGTNAHLVLEEARQEAQEEGTEQEEGPGSVDGAVVPWVVSGRTAEALREQARRLDEFAAEGASTVDVGRSLATTRSVFEHRAVVVGRDREALLAGLAALAEGKVSPDVVSGAAAGAPGPGPVLVFPGQGSQWVGMGAQLLAESTVFAARIAECEQALSPYVDWSLAEVLSGDGSELSRVEVVQPALWAVMVSLAAMWAEYGVIPAAVVGHSQGEIAAACVAGALTLEDGAKIVALRSLALRKLSGSGAMASLGVGQEQAAKLIDGHPGVGIAAVNGPSSTVISGPPDQVAAVVADAEAREMRGRVIDVDYASHSRQVDAITDELTRTLAGIRPASASVAFYSAVTGSRIDTEGLDTDYWVTNLRRPVRFADAVAALLTDGHRIFIESSSHPVLTLGLQETFEEADIDAAVTVPTLRREDGGLSRLGLSLAQAFTAGCAVRWASWFPATRTAALELPTYAFQRSRYWLDAPVGTQDAAGLGLATAGHPLLGAAADLAEGGIRLFTGRISRHSHPWLAQHTLFGHAVVPASVLTEWALRAADEAGCAAIDDLTLESPLVLPEAAGVQVQIVVGPDDRQGGQRQRDLHIYARPDGAAALDGDAPWTCHARGQLVAESPGQPTAKAPDAVWPPSGAEPVDLSGFYERADATGVGYGPVFQGLRALWRRGAELFAEAVLPQEAPDADGFGIHPALLDAVLQPAVLGVRPPEAGQVWLPFALSGVSLWATGATSVRVRLSPLDGQADQADRVDRVEGAGGAERAKSAGSEGEPGGFADQAGRTWQVSVSDPTGADVLTCEGLVLVAAESRQLRAVGERTPDLYALRWIPVSASVPASVQAQGSASDPADPSTWASLGEEYSGLDALMAALDSGAPAPPVVLATTGGSLTGDEAADGLVAAERTDTLIERWLADARLAGTRLVLTTHGAVATGDGRLPAPAAAAVWGLVRNAQAQHPGHFILIDTDTDTGAGIGAGAEALEQAVATAIAADEPQLALRAGRVLAPRFAPPTQPAVDEPQPLDPEGTVLLTGSAGGLVGALAEYLVHTGQSRNLLIVSGGVGGELAEVADRLMEQGATVQLAAADVADASAFAETIVEAIAGIDANHPLTGVIHATATATDTDTDNETAANPAGDTATDKDASLHGAFGRTWAATAGAAAALAAATAHLPRPLALFAHLSPAQAALGIPQPAADAAADAFCEALALQRHVTGTTGLALAYGPPAAPRPGIQETAPGQVPALLDTARAHGGPLLLAVPLAARALAAEGAATLPAPLRALVAAQTPVRRTAASRRPPTDWAGRLAPLSAAEQLRLLIDAVRTHAAGVLGRTDPGALRGDATFKQLGLDSLTAVELRNRLVEDTGLRLPTALVFRYPTPAAIAGHLRERLTGQDKDKDHVGGEAPQAPSGPLTAGSVLSDLTRMENTLTAAADQLPHGDTGEITTRLEALLARWKTTNIGADDDSAAHRLKAASADQIFDFIDNELGVTHDTSRATPTPKAG
ncbi:beta-ketoacyl synthase N-terminal-like domain-containing protein [Streptomyces sp. NPDC057302]|uniref:beta-ketoacyl synthase N-terminal-like domain-containing protein n=1 Tax=Streptomyces sp. NPDC057302 TaxID=3346094 RepID=UPI00362E80B1